MANTKAQQANIEHSTGVRYSVLLELPYFDAPRMCIVDPMHNFFLGTAKRVLEIWRDTNVLSHQNFQDMQEKIDNFITPRGLGRIPSKIASNFSGFTAKQWKNWTLYFSLYLLKDVLPREHYQCWQIFCKACFLLCRRHVRESDVNEADGLFEEFCKYFTRLYGPASCTINMHLHCHLSECVKDYGPVYAFWLFAYERFNGIMGSYHTNCKNISVQLTRRFLDSKVYAPAKWPTEFNTDFMQLLEKFQYHQGSLMQSTFETELSNSDVSYTTPLVPIFESVWNSQEIVALKDIISVHRSVSKDDIHVIMVAKRSQAVLHNGFLLSGKKSQFSICQSNNIYSYISIG